MKAAQMAKQLVKVDFEVFGRVQGVFFRKYTQGEADSLGLKGFCRNTSAGTVSGTMEGPRPQVEKMYEGIKAAKSNIYTPITIVMKAWLRSTGSPMSSIEKAEFRNEHEIEAYTLKGFGIEKTI